MPKIAIIADPHFGIYGPDRFEWLTRRLEADPPELFIVAGDFGSTNLEAHYLTSLETGFSTFARLPCPKLWTAGNHDVGVPEERQELDARSCYEADLPRLSSEHGWHLLDQAPYSTGDVAVVGSIGPITFDVDGPGADKKGWFSETYLRLPSGTHADWEAEILERFSGQLESACAEARTVLVVIHYPPFASDWTSSFLPILSRFGDRIVAVVHGHDSSLAGREERDGVTRIGLPDAKSGERPDTNPVLLLDL